MRPSMPRDNFEKHDRLIRLMRELTLFQAQPRGLTSAQIAQKMEISQRQAQRDLVALESEYKVPFVKQGTRWTLIEGYFLPPVNFTVPEAMAMVVGARLMWRYADRANPFAQAAYEKLAAALPGPMKEPVMQVADGLADKPDDGAWTRVVATRWHESQEVHELAGGGVELRLVIAEPTEIRSWILGWGKECEVVSPADLRESIGGELEEAAAACEKRSMRRSMAG